MNNNNNNNNNIVSIKYSSQILLEHFSFVLARMGTFPWVGDAKRS
jgi:hypothetical protein